MKFILPFVLVLFSVLTCNAQVKSVITGPNKVDKGDLVVLDSVGSSGEVYKWVLVKSKKVFLPVDNNKRIVFASGTDGDYEFYLFVGGHDKDKNLAVDSSSFIVKVGTPEQPKPIKPPVKPTDPPDVTKVTQVTYVYEKDNNNVPRPVSFGLQRLNAIGIIATEFEEDTLDGNGKVPTQYAVALEVARKAGLPALVFQVGQTVINVIKDPKLETDVIK